MVLDLIRRYIEQYKAYLIAVGHRHDGLPEITDNNSHQLGIDHWFSLNTFQDNWNIDASDFKLMYQNSFASSLSNDLWEGQFYYPKRAMTELIDRDTELIRSMFKELFNENLDIEGRIDRFIYHCDEISTDIMRSNPKYQSHYHDGYRMISVYLAFQYPTHYTIYTFDEYKNFMALVKAKPVTEPVAIGRFFKAMRTIYAILSKDEELIKLYRNSLLSVNAPYLEESLFLARDFYTFCGHFQGKITAR